MCTKWPPNDIEHYQVKGTLYNYSQVPNFIAFSSMASHFRVTGHFKRSASNDPQMTLKTKRSRVPHIHFTSIRPKFQIFFLYGQPFSSWRKTVFGRNKFFFWLFFLKAPNRRTKCILRQAKMFFSFFSDSAEQPHEKKKKSFGDLLMGCAVERCDLLWMLHKWDVA